MFSFSCFRFLGMKDGLQKELVYPKRLFKSDPTNSKIENHIHKRSTNSFSNDVSYSISAFGNDFLLDLTFTKDFISDNFIVQTYSDNITWIEEKVSSPEDCFYRGTLQNKSPSWAIFNLCKGLVSFHFL